MLFWKDKLSNFFFRYRRFTDDEGKQEFKFESYNLIFIISINQDLPALAPI